MIKVIRIEHVDGKGPWHTKSVDIYLYPELDHYVSNHCYKDGKKGGFPTPQAEGLSPNFNEYCYCAYRNKKIFKKWVSKEDILALISIGFKIYELELNMYYEGLHQVVFREFEIKSKKDITNQFIN